MPSSSDNCAHTRNTLIRFLDSEAAEHNWIGVACKTDVPFPSVKPLGRMFDLAAVELIDVDVENLSTVERDFDRSRRRARTVRDA